MIATRTFHARSQSARIPFASHHIHTIAIAIVLALVSGPLCSTAAAQKITPQNEGTTPDPLRMASGSIESLVRRVSSSVVQLMVTGYRPVEDPGSRTEIAFERGRVIGSGTIIDPAGYILTNAHVVAGAERIDVVLPDGDVDGPPKLGSSSVRTVEAAIVGVASDLDLALLQVNATGLTALPLANYDAVRQGELVFAFGSPDGFRNSVVMGMVSAVARQVEPDSPLVYIQTDAAINPGNSGGPLVNVKGELIGINTFIRSMSGGSEGLGFALPSAMLGIAWPQLRDFGHLHRAAIGLAVQSVTPDLASGLSLPSDARLIVSDVTPDSPASKTPLQIGDLITKIDGHPVDSLTLAGLYESLYTLQDKQTMTLEASRNNERFTVSIAAQAIPHVCERGATIDVTASLIEPLGILGMGLDDRLVSSIDGLRQPSGVIVTALVEGAHAVRTRLERGDVIHAVNNTSVTSPSALRDAIAKVSDDTAIVLQIERNGQLTYMVIDRESL